MFKKIKNRDDVELKVCKGCDAPLPYKPEKISYFLSATSDPENNISFLKSLYVYRCIPHSACNN